MSLAFGETRLEASAHCEIIKISISKMLIQSLHKSTLYGRSAGIFLQILAVRRAQVGFLFSFSAFSSVKMFLSIRRVAVSAIPCSKEACRKNC
jgi:hypothetical protein